MPETFFDESMCGPCPLRTVKDEGKRADLLHERRDLTRGTPRYRELLELADCDDTAEALVSCVEDFGLGHCALAGIESGDEL